MKFKLLWTKRSIKDLRALDRRIAERIIVSLEEASKDPFRHLKKLEGFPLYSLRVGKYRVIIAVEAKSYNLLVLAIEHRKKAYKRIR